MNKRFFLYVIAVFLLVLGCATTEHLSNFADDMHRGDQQLKRGQYPTALASFLKANTYHPSAGALAFAAMAAYKMNDIPLADSYLVQAHGQNADQVVTCIILGYWSLVRFNQGDEIGGIKSLSEYLAAYKSLVPGSASMPDVELMATSGRIDINRLQQTIDRQIQELPIDFDRMGEDAGLRGGR